VSDFSRLTHPILNQAGRDWYFGLGKRKSHFPSKEDAVSDSSQYIINEQWVGLALGQLYEVSWSDCCAKGYFTAELAEKVLDDDGEGGQFLAELRFANGVAITGEAWHVEIKPVERNRGWRDPLDRP
jgi:hypothetical protein